MVKLIDQLASSGVLDKVRQQQASWRPHLHSLLTERLAAEVQPQAGACDSGPKLCCLLAAVQVGECPRQACLLVLAAELI